MQKKSQSLSSEPDYVIDMLRQHVASATSLYPTTQVNQRIEFPAFDVPVSKKHLPIKALAVGLEKQQKNLKAALVFSSLATQDMIENWSDADIFVVVADEAIADMSRFLALREQLIELEEHLYEFDPWQHHGIQFITEADLRFYPESFLPLAALAPGKSLLGPCTLEFNLRDSRVEQENYFHGIAKLMAQASEGGELKHHCRNGVCLQENFAFAQDNFYQLKYFISVILLLPSLYIGLVDKPIYKRESFTTINNHFTNKQLELVRACEQVRALFDSLKPEGNAIPEEVKAVLGNNYFTRAATLTQTMVEAYERDQSSPTTRN